MCAQAIRSLGILSRPVPPGESAHHVLAQEAVPGPAEEQRGIDERRRGFSRGIPFDIEARLRFKTGEYRWQLFQYNPLKDGRGEIIRWYVTSTDIDDRKRTEDRLKNENLVVLAVSAPKRLPLIADVPSIVEAGYPDAVFRFWNGLSAPAKTPPDVLQKLHDATEKALAEPAIQEKLAKLGVEPSHMSVAEFKKFFEEDFAATRELAKQANIQPVD